MFYDKYIELCRFKGVSPTTAALEMGFSKATPTKWKKSKSYPSGKNLKKIAEYFGVTEFFLLQDNWPKGEYTDEEKTIIELYRKADDRDRETIRHILNRYQEDTASAVG